MNPSVSCFLTTLSGTELQNSQSCIFFLLVFIYLKVVHRPLKTRKLRLVTLGLKVLISSVLVCLFCPDCFYICSMFGMFLFFIFACIFHCTVHLLLVNILIFPSPIWKIKCNETKDPVLHFVSCCLFIV